MDDKTELLRHLPLFAQLEPRAIEAVATLAREAEAPAGTVLMREGEPAESFYVLVDGTVRVERGGTTIRSISGGGFLGEIALVQRSPRTATAVCATDCRLLTLGSFEFERLLVTFPEVRSRIAAAILRRPRAR
jgi:CRP/FNR family transcriptional regulator, cyclic AMP receptor protein